MNAVIAAGAGFLAAVLWIDLTFDVQVQRRGTDRAPDEVLASIAPYYRRVTTGASAGRLRQTRMMLEARALVSFPTTRPCFSVRRAIFK